MPKRPRHYAVEIAALPEEERRDAVSATPFEYQDWVRFYLTDWADRGRLDTAATMVSADVA